MFRYKITKAKINLGLIIIMTCLIFGCKSDPQNLESESHKTKIETAEKLPKKQTSSNLEKPKTTSNSKQLSETIELGKIDYKFISTRLLQKINQERKKLSLPTFKTNNDLFKAAKLHNDYMVRADILDHSELGTSTPNMIDRIKKTGGRFRTAGENIQYEGFIIRTTNGVESIIAPNYEDLAEQLWQNWKTSPSHYKNIINPEFKYIGTSLKWSDKKTAVFATQLYGG